MSPFTFPGMGPWAPREDGTKADLDPLGHEKEGSGQQACKDSQGPTPMEPPIWLQPLLVSIPELSTQPFLTEPCPPGQMQEQQQGKSMGCCGPIKLSSQNQALRENPYLAPAQAMSSSEKPTPLSLSSSSRSRHATVAQQKAEPTCQQVWLGGGGVHWGTKTPVLGPPRPLSFCPEKDRHL